MIKLTNTDKATPSIINPHQVQTENTLFKHTTEHIINNVMPTGSKSVLAIYHHQTLGSSPVPTIVKACCNNKLNTFPGLESKLILRHLLPSRATNKGHMIRPRSGIQSTRNNRAEILDAQLQVDDMNPPKQICNANENGIFVFAALADNINGVMYRDLTGRFPVESYWGMKYIFIAYIYDENVILMRPMKNRTDACMIAVFKEIYEYLKERNCKPKLYVMENECSKAVQKFIKKQEVPIQLVEPGNHRVNAAEMGVKTGRYHLISSLVTVTKSSPLQLWCQYIP